MHQHNWRAVYKDGTHLDRYTHDGKPNGYENIKRDQLIAFELWDQRVNKRVVRVNMEGRRRLIYRARTYVTGRGFLRNYSISILSYCKSCAPYRDYHEGECKICDRDVYFPWDRINRRYIFCSKNCSKQFWINFQREKRLKERQITCQKVCGECKKSFKAPRSDTKFCSTVCKQKAYRARQAETQTA